METARLHQTWRHCPTGQIPMIFNGGFHCMKLPSTSGLQGLRDHMNPTMIGVGLGVALAIWYLMKHRE